MTSTRRGAAHVELLSYTENLLSRGYTNKEVSELTGLHQGVVKNIDKARLQRLYTEDGKTFRKPEMVVSEVRKALSMDMLGFLRLRAWDAQREAEKKKPRQRFIDEVWPGVKLQ